MIALRETVIKSIEDLRSAGTVGSSLASKAELWADGAVGEALAWLDDELRFVLLTSEASAAPFAEAPPDAQVVRLEQGSVALRVSPSGDPKCVRCWHQRPDVGASVEHPELCGRCIENVDGPGETRQIA